MARGQVAARMEGDIYQGLYFWFHAASLFVERSRVVRVDLEHDAASGVDDVAVFYSDPGTNIGSGMCKADYYQVKYHVDLSSAYSPTAMIDPQFIHAKSSLLARFLNAYERISPDQPSIRLILISNWAWDSNDRLATAIRAADGALPEEFFTSSDRSELGKIRTNWRDHLGIADDHFRSFARTLRFDLGAFGRSAFRQWVYDRLALAGLYVPPANQAACPY
ncbi:MAG: hypothetical protein ABIF77_09555, partial [bacterium]